ncbi:MAG: cobaltochelatase CobN [Oleispira sp.]|jgi:cobaltochelatase CobN
MIKQLTKRSASLQCKEQCRDKYKEKKRLTQGLYKSLIVLLSFFTFISASHADSHAGSHAGSHADSHESNQASKPVAPAKILFLGDSHLSKAKSTILIESAKKQGLALEAMSAGKFAKDKGMETLCDYQLVLMQAVSEEAAGGMYGAYPKAIAQCGNVQALTNGFDQFTGLNKGISADDKQAINIYLSNGIRTNFENMFAYINTHLLNTPQTYEAAIILPENGFYHPQFSTQLTGDKTEFYNWLEASNSSSEIKESNNLHNVNVAVLFHRSAIESEQTQIVDSTLAAIEKNGANAFAVFFEGSDNEDFIQLIQGKVNSLINYRMLHEAQKNKNTFARLNVPVLHGLTYREGDREAFNADHAGISAMMSPYFLMMPESAGIIDPTMIATTDPKTRIAQPMLDHIDAMAQRAIKQGQLSAKANADKKLSLFVWNYPPGDKNMGAAFLNVPDSIVNIATAMKEAGYNVDVQPSETLIDNIGQILRPFYSKQGLEALMDKGLSDYLPVKDYTDWLNTLPSTIKDDIIAHWGDPIQHPYVRTVNGEPAFIIPQMKLGNLIIMPQPSRSDDADKHKKLYHNTSAPINHFYLAVYLYAKEKFKVDAFINLGTHGSQEWLPGKERGLSMYDAPQLTVGNVPVVYPYIMDNVGEAMQGKRRGRATMISHMTPGFAEAGYYGDMAELEELLEEHMLLAEGKTKQVVEKNIIDLAAALNVFEYVSFTEAQMRENFDEFMDVLHDYMHELAAESQPLGMHTFGDTLNDIHLMTTVAQMLGSEFKTQASTFENKHDIKLHNNPDVFSQKMEDNQVVQIDDTSGFKFLWASLIEHQSLEVSDSLAKYLEQAKDFAQRIRSQQEIPSLLSALQGEFVDVGYGGDPVRSHDAVPTGKNLLGFNPAKVPSKAAWEVGQKLVEDLIAKHYAEKGEYPNKLAFSLWSLETMRHHGVLESQVLAAMGVKPKWDENGFLRGTEIIPYSELKRPRVDVVMSATGLYRDAFPNVMLMLAKAIKQVAELKEGNNSIYKNSEALKTELIAEGKSAEEANYLSSVRIFSNETGAYGSGLADTSLASDTWETDAKLSDLYLKRMGYAFGSDAKRWSDKVSGLYGKALSGTDAVLFSRSTNLYGMITSDDPFQYFGGMSLAIRNLDGKSPEMYIANLREKNKVKSESFDRFMARELRNRSFHPRWIEEVQKEGYSGALQMLDRMNNFWGWTVMHPDGITDSQWQEFADIYVKDKYDMDMREFFENSNPTNLAQMIERMLEAERKDYWQTDDETIKQLLETYLEVKRDHKVLSDNETFKDYVADKAQGFGLGALLAASDTAVAQDLAEQTQANSAEEMVEGQKLEQQEQPQTDDEYNWQTLGFVLLLLFAFVVGGAVQFRSTRSARSVR